MRNAKQTVNGKAFEYSIFCKLLERISCLTTVSPVHSSAVKNAAECYSLISGKDQLSFNRCASEAVNLLVELEPKLVHCVSEKDILELEIVSDSQGQSGDVRDVIAIRAKQGWEVGISAKSNHKAVKHSRLSNDIDFGKKWFGKPCSNVYFDEIEPIFSELKRLRVESKSTKTWQSLGNYHDSVYVPILSAFIKELDALHKADPQQVATSLVCYLIGVKDFYKIMRNDRSVELEAYNIHGTLNQASGAYKSKYAVKQIKFPSRIFDIDFLRCSKNTISVILDEGWQISFRIHNASSRVEPSLKFDINLISAPNNMFKHTLIL